MIGPLFIYMDRAVRARTGGGDDDEEAGGQTSIAIFHLLSIGMKPKVCPKLELSSC